MRISLGNTLGLAGVLASAVTLSGCEAFEPNLTSDMTPAQRQAEIARTEQNARNMWGNFAGEAVGMRGAELTRRGDFRGAASAATTQNMINNWNQHSQNMQVARAGKSDVNIYNGQQGGETMAQQYARQRKGGNSNNFPGISPQIREGMKIAERDGIYIVRWDNGGEGKTQEDLLRDGQFTQTLEFRKNDWVAYLVKVPSGMRADMSISGGDGKVLTERRFNPNTSNEDLFIPLSHNLSLEPKSPYFVGVLPLTVSVNMNGRNHLKRDISIRFDEPRKQGALTIAHPGIEEINMFACNYNRDFNNDGLIDFPGEMIGIKTGFGVDEQVVFGICAYRKAPFDKFKLSIFDNSGREVPQSPLENPNGEIGGILQTYEPGLLKPGTYMATYYFDNQLLFKQEITVEDRK